MTDRLVTDVEKFKESWHEHIGSTPRQRTSGARRTGLWPVSVPRSALLTLGVAAIAFLLIPHCVRSLAAAEPLLFVASYGAGEEGAITTLALVIPPLFFFCKVIATLCCAYYAFKIEKQGTGGGGFKALAEKDDGVELGVAE